MKVALSVWENRISPVFDSAHHLLIVDIENGSVEKRHCEPFHSDLPFFRAVKLSHTGIRVLICGAISQALEDMIKSYGILVISFVSGKVDQVLQAYLKDTLSRPEFRMPGWTRKSGNGPGSLKDHQTGGDSNGLLNGTIKTNE